jgi:O-antigen/teichoic acid export membrane protein
MPLTMPASLSRKTVVSNVVSLTVGSAIAQLLMAASVLLVARQLGPSNFGEYAATFSAVALSSVLFNLGLDTWLLRSGARRPGDLRTLLGDALTVKLALGIPWLAAAAVVLPRLNPQTFQLPLILVSGLSVWMEGLFSVGLSAFKALLRNETTALLLGVARGGVLVLTVLLALAGSQDPIMYAGVRLAMGAFALAATLLLLPVRPALARGARQVAGTARESSPYALSDLLVSVYVQADVTIAAVILGKNAVGFYAPASNLISALSVVPLALFYVTVPVLTNALHSSWPAFRKLLRTTLIGHLLVGLALWAVTALSTGILPLLLGEAFRPSALLLAILSPILFLKTCSFGAAAILVAVGWQTRRLYLQATAATVNVILNLLLIRQYGISGVAWIYVASELLLAVGYLALVWAWMRGPGRHPETRSLL